MNPSLENPFRPSDQRATKRLFSNTQTERGSKKKKEKVENKLLKYGPLEIVFSQMRFLKALEKLIPQDVLVEEKVPVKKLLISRLKKIEQGKIKEIDLSNLVLRQLPALPASIQRLDCANNQLRLLPTLPVLLQELYCENNQLSQLPDLPPTLQELDCYNNQLSTLPQLPATLHALKCFNNRLNQKNIEKIIAHKNRKDFKI